MSFLENYQKEIDKAGGLEPYVQEKAYVRKPLLDRIRYHTDPHGKVAEWGSGTGILAMQLASEGFPCLSIELDSEMIALQKNIRDKLKAAIEIAQGDIRTFEPNGIIDTSYNSGVLEHFDETEIIDIVNHIMRFSRTFVFGVPTIFNMGNLIGDERLWTYWKWKKILEKTDGEIVERFSYFSRRRIRERINRLLGCNLYPISTGIGFVLENPHLTKYEQ